MSEKRSRLRETGLLFGLGVSSFLLGNSIDNIPADNEDMMEATAVSAKIAGSIAVFGSLISLSNELDDRRDRANQDDPAFERKRLLANLPKLRYGLNISLISDRIDAISDDEKLGQKMTFQERFKRTILAAHEPSDGVSDVSAFQQDIRAIAVDFSFCLDPKDLDHDMIEDVQAIGSLLDDTAPLADNNSWYDYLRSTAENVMLNREIGNL